MRPTIVRPLLALLLACATALGAVEPPQIGRPDRILVKPKAGITGPALAAFHQAQGVGVVRELPRIGNIQILSVPAGQSSQGLVTRYADSGLVEFAEPDHWVSIASTLPNDPKFTDGTLWAWNNTGQSGGTVDADIDAPEAWDTITSASNIIVAVIDTGVRYTHSDLSSNMWTSPHDGSHGLNALAGTNDPNDDHGHGTHLAGTIGASGNNGIGVVGVAWQVRILACKFLNSFGNGNISDALPCIDYAITNGASVLNLSWGGPDTSQALSAAITAARDAGVIVVASAGNNARNTDVSPYYPASLPHDNIVSVTATTRTDALYSLSSFGPESVDLGVPGASIHSTHFLSDSAYITLNGTSQSAAVASGALALLAARFPEETHRQLIQRLLAGADPLPALSGRCVTGGRLNLDRALNPPPADPPLVQVVAASPGQPAQLRLTGSPFRAYAVDATEDFVGWTALATNFTGPDGSFLLTDSAATNLPVRIYRGATAP